MYKPTIIAADFEASGLDYWSPDFEVHSLALAWRGEDRSLRSELYEGVSIETILTQIQAQGIPLVVHNMGYEYGVLLYQYPNLATIPLYDTMRLAQVYDNGGDNMNPDKGFGLTNCVKRILKRPDHKLKYYQWLRENGVKKGQEGAHLAELPPEMYRDYNIEDAIETLLLYEHITGHFRDIQYDWSLDHTLYTEVTKQISRAQARGVAADRAILEKSRDSIRQELSDLDSAFKIHFEAPISRLEAIWREEWVLASKPRKAVRSDVRASQSIAKNGYSIRAPKST